MNKLGYFIGGAIVGVVGIFATAAISMAKQEREKKSLSSYTHSKNEEVEISDKDLPDEVDEAKVNQQTQFQETEEDVNISTEETRAPLGSPERNLEAVRKIIKIKQKLSGAKIAKDTPDFSNSDTSQCVKEEESIDIKLKNLEEVEKRLEGTETWLEILDVLAKAKQKVLLN